MFSRTVRLIPVKPSRSHKRSSAIQESSSNSEISPVQRQWRRRPARRPCTIRIYQLASKIHTGQRLHLEQFGLSGRRATSSCQIRRRSRLQEVSGPISQHGLGESAPESLLRGRQGQWRGDRRVRGLPARREGFPFDAGARTRRQA
jgi:hypothetical protein